MNEELAKQLKEAGFPLSWRTPGIFLSCQKLHTIHRFEDDSECFEPTLSELVEACGDKFSSLDKDEESWQAEYIHSVFGHGRTPEEAVAKLWLELNKNQ